MQCVSYTVEIRSVQSIRAHRSKFENDPRVADNSAKRIEDRFIVATKLSLPRARARCPEFLRGIPLNFPDEIAVETATDNRELE
jgi:hypothetical protein